MKIKQKYIAILSLFIFLLLSKATLSNEDPSFLVVGHGYPIFRDSVNREQFIREVNELNTDIVFFLGDCDFFNPIIFRSFSKIKHKTLFAPGNHDIRSSTEKEQYLKNIGYLDTTFNEGIYNYILINSSESIKEINQYLRKNIIKKESVINIIFSHHRIWTDNKVSAFPYSDHKSYLAEELDSTLLSYVKYIIAGNVNRYEKLYPNNVYSVDQYRNTIAYSCGMGYKKASLVKFIKKNKTLIAIPYTYNKIAIKKHENKRTNNPFFLRRRKLILFIGLFILITVFLRKLILMSN